MASQLLRKEGEIVKLVVTVILYNFEGPSQKGGSFGPPSLHPCNIIVQRYMHQF